MKNIPSYISQNQNLLLSTLRDLCAIPAPSGNEHKRAEYCLNWLKNAGLTDVYVDQTLNVVCPINCNTSQNITVVAAHTDTVFPDVDFMPVMQDKTKVYSPGVGDNTASLAVLLLTAKYFAEYDIKPKDGIIFLCNSCEEGLGNLKGTKQLFSDFKGRIKQFISLDTNLNKIANRCVGSHRYKVTVTAQGGHSYLAFGNTNALAQLSKIVTDIYKIQIPQKANTKTTYNVGIIQGGTSVNTIPQTAFMLCEYRSNDIECLNYMEAEFNRIFAETASNGITVSAERIGERPCMGDIDILKVDNLCQKCKSVIEPIIGREVTYISSSTDCNIPLSLGVPAACIGVYYGDGMHTREEWVEKSSLPIGLEVCIKTLLALI